MTVSVHSNLMKRDAPAMPPRLEGDHMIAWVRMTFQEEQLAQAKQALASQLLTELGYTPGDYLLSDDAYIVSREEFNARVKTFPLQAQESRDSRPDQDAAPQTPGSAIPKEDRHTHVPVDS